MAGEINAVKILFSAKSDFLFTAQVSVIFILSFPDALDVAEHAIPAMQWGPAV